MTAPADPPAVRQLVVPILATFTTSFDEVDILAVVGREHSGGVFAAAPRSFPAQPATDADICNLFADLVRGGHIQAAMNIGGQTVWGPLRARLRYVAQQQSPNGQQPSKSGLIILPGA